MDAASTARQRRGPFRTGTVGDRAVKCITPEWLVRFHTGYELDETDWSDVSALCERFGIPIPDEYARFQRDSGPR
jgi:lincosamide nucleotidyltransferase A/C/D/E